MFDRSDSMRPQCPVSRDPTGRASAALARRRATRRAAANAFTLVELMVSIAIAVIVILGIEQVFSIGSKTIGAGQSISSMNRDDRAAQAVFTADFQSADTGSDCPAFMIRSGQVYAFESASDKAGAINQNDPSQDPNFAAFSPANTIPVTYYNYRNHRIDRVAFFARNFFARLTGGTDNGGGSSPTQFVSPTTSNEAYIWYGHLALPDNYYVSQAGTESSGGLFYEPGDTYSSGNDRNDNNLFASDWILGRAAILLVPQQTADQSYIGNDSNPLQPLAFASPSAANTNTLLYQSRYDQAYTSISNYDQTLSTYYAQNPSSSGNYSTWASGKSGCNWYTYLLGNPPTGSPETSGRFQAVPFPIKYGAAGMTNTSLAKTFPVFIRGCTQFIVEYAGNFYTKTSTTNPTPVITNGASPPDPTGQLDFQYVNGVKQVRWYGFPRHTSGSTTNSILPATDVVPLGCFLKASGITALPMFERFYSPSGGTWPPSSVTASTDFSASGTVPNGAEYVAAWGPDTSADVSSPLPKMIRITLAMDDPNGNVATPQWFEYVINLNP